MWPVPKPSTGHWYQRMYGSWNITYHLPAIVSRLHGTQKSFVLRKKRNGVCTHLKTGLAGISQGLPKWRTISSIAKGHSIAFSMGVLLPQGCLQWVDPLARFDPVCLVAHLFRTPKIKQCEHMLTIPNAALLFSSVPSDAAVLETVAGDGLFKVQSLTILTLTFLAIFIINPKEWPRLQYYLYVYIYIYTHIHTYIHT